MTTIPRSHLAAVLLLLGLPALAAQQERQEPPERPTTDRQEKQPKPEWPELRGRDENRVKAAIRRLDADKEKVVAAAEQELIGYGAAAAPLLLQRLDDKTLEDGSRLMAILDRVVTTEYLPLVLERADFRAVKVRRWVSRWLARSHDERARKALVEACDDDDAVVVWHGWLGRAGFGDVEAVPHLIARCREHFRDEVDLIAAVLPAARSDEMAAAVLDRTIREDELTRVAGLRLLRYLAPPSYAGRVALGLDASQHNVKKATINALRVIVDGDEPLENLSVFQAIEQAKRWKERVR